MFNPLAWFRPASSPQAPSPLPGARRLARLLDQQSPEALHKDALALQRLLDEPAAAVLFEHAARYVDAYWQSAEGPGLARAQGMAQMLNYLAIMPEMMISEARRTAELEAKAAKKAKARTEEDWLGTLNRGRAYFEGRA